MVTKFGTVILIDDNCGVGALAFSIAAADVVKCHRSSSHVQVHFVKAKALTCPFPVNSQ